MPNWLSRWLLFFASYSPLGFILAVLFIGRRLLFPAVIVATLLALAGFAVYWQLVQRIEPAPLKVISMKRRDDAVLTYIVTYLFPFFSASYGGPRQVVATAMMVVLIGILYTRTDMIFVNPVLNVMRYDLVQVEGPSGVYMLITKSEPKVNETIQVIQVGRRMFVRKEPRIR
jgi:hypothetical protein